MIDHDLVAPSWTQLRLFSTRNGKRSNKPSHTIRTPSSLQGPSPERELILNAIKHLGRSGGDGDHDRGPPGTGTTIVAQDRGVGFDLAAGDLIEVFLGEQLVATHRRAPQGTLRVTLPEHAQRIRALTRAQGASIRGRQVQYTQLLPSQGLVAASPEVQTRSLELYEALLSAESLS